MAKRNTSAYRPRGLDAITFDDLRDFEKRMMEFIRQSLDALAFAVKNQDKEFYTPSEFAKKTGLKYHAVIKRCKKGHLKAYQDRPGASWVIDASEIHRLREMADLGYRLGSRRR